MDGLEPSECQSQSLMPYHLATRQYRNGGRTWKVDLDIGDKSQPLAGADTDDLLALEVGKFHGHGRSLPIRLHQFMQREIMKER